MFGLHYLIRKPEFSQIFVCERKIGGFQVHLGGQVDAYGGFAGA